MLVRTGECKKDGLDWGQNVSQWCLCSPNLSICHGAHLLRSKQLAQTPRDQMQMIAGSDSHDLAMSSPESY